MTSLDNSGGGGVRFDATINLGHILTFFGFIATGITIYTSMNGRVLVLEEFKANQIQTDKRQDFQIEDNKKAVKEDLHEINNKLDRIIERVIDRKIAQ